MFVALAGVGCGDGSSTSDVATNASPSRPATDVADEVTAKLPWESVVALNEAFVQRDWVSAGLLISPNSPAAEYLQYREQVEQAQEAAGAPIQQGGTVSADEAAGTVTATIAETDVTYTWSDFESDDEGLVVGWSTEQGPLSEQLVPSGEAVAGGGAEISISSGYVTNEGELYLVVAVTAVDDMIIVDDSTVLRAASGENVQSTAFVGPSEVAVAETALVVYSMPTTQRAGTLVYEVQNSYDAPLAVEVPLN